MNREIKFRAWDKEDNVMRDVSDIFCLPDGITCVTYRSKGIGVTPLIQEDIILIQYTGLKDKNGVEIYEGDVLRYCYHVSKPDSDFHGVVEYHDKVITSGYECSDRFVGFILKGDNGGGDYYFTSIPDIEDIEVIGNIYQNPELLEG